MKAVFRTWTHFRQTRSVIALICFTIIFSGTSVATADLVTDIVGTENYPTDPIGDTLTGGFLATADQSFGWTHSYSPVALGSVVAATLTIDLVDADNGQLDIYVGPDASGTLLGIATGNDNGSPGPWQPLSDPGSVDTVINIDPSHFADLADGSFQLFAQNNNGTNNLGIWGSNRARLTINPSSVPEPGSFILLAFAGISILSRRQRD